MNHALLSAHADRVRIGACNPVFFWCAGFTASGKLEAQKKESARLTKTAQDAAMNAAAEAAVRAATAVANAQATAPQLPSLQNDELADIAIGIVEAYS